MNARTAIRVLIGLAVIVIIVVVLSVTGVLPKFKTSASGSGKWQAVFLTNGQVYFGKVVAENSNEVVLRKIYYLQVEQQIQPERAQAADDKTQPKLSLVKLGNELHGPEDEMKINRDQVLFIEDLKDDGKVVTAIVDFEKNGGQSTAAPAPAPSVTP